MKIFPSLPIKTLFCLWASLLLAGPVPAQDSSTYKLRLSLSLLDLPQQQHLPHRLPSMQQSMELSNNVYDLAYLGLEALGDKLARPRRRPVLNKVAKYALSLALVRYGSELPIPLGVWAHEEYHRAVLGTQHIGAQNGNWLLTRWDGTVFGVSDEQLASLKQNQLPVLLYSYTAGVQAQTQSTYTNMVGDFFHRRSFYKNALYLYNAWQVRHYLGFAGSPATDQVKEKSWPHESPIAAERDFAGSDLTSWAYDMFTPAEAYGARDDFPGGQGENRRLGISELPREAQQFLREQKRLAWFNFFNPAILGLNRFRFSSRLSLTFFTQYNPTHFGHHLSLQLPVYYLDHRVVAGLHRYHSQTSSFNGYSLGLLDQAVGVSGKVTAGLQLAVWQQPAAQSFFDHRGRWGGAAEATLGFQANKNLRLHTTLTAKTQGWMAGNPYLGRQVGARAGLSYQVFR